jgi:hypothetical protein
MLRNAVPIRRYMISSMESLAVRWIHARRVKRELHLGPRAADAKRLEPARI